MAQAGIAAQESEDGRLLYIAVGERDAIIYVLNIATGEQRPLAGMPKLGIGNDWVLGSKGIFFVDFGQQPGMNLSIFLAAGYKKDSARQTAQIVRAACRSRQTKSVGSRIPQVDVASQRPDAGGGLPMTPSSPVRPLNLSRPLIYVSRPLRGLRGGTSRPQNCASRVPGFGCQPALSGPRSSYPTEPSLLGRERMVT